MEKLIKFALDLMERENQDPASLPSQNPNLNPHFNAEINVTQNPTINQLFNGEINPTFNVNWKQNQWSLFKKTVIWHHLTQNQKLKCELFFQSS